MRREIEDEVCEVRDIFELENGERMATYEREVSEWKTYEKSRVRLFLISVLLPIDLIKQNCFIFWYIYHVTHVYFHPIIFHITFNI